MSALPNLYLVRHGETEWAVQGRHTGRTDIPLTAVGEAAAQRVGDRLKGLQFACVWTSPAIRARRTCELAGFGGVSEADPDLWEWDYGQFEGLKSAEIHAQQPSWVVFRDGAPGGESPAQIATRVDRVIARVRAVDGDALIFAHGHISRAIAARWIGLGVEVGQVLMLSTAAVSILGYDHDRSEPAIRLWNDVGHL